MSRHRLEAVRPRYGRMALLVAAATVTTVALVGGVAGAGDNGGAGGDDLVAVDAAGDATASAGVEPAPLAVPSSSTSSLSAAEVGDEPDLTQAEDSATDGRTDVTSPGTSPRTVTGRTLRRDKTVPTDSGTGYRIVFSESRQRVWLVGSDEQVQDSYLVSGSLYDNLDPGSYHVFSRSEQAYGIDDSGTMKYFVRFAEGPNAAIGFHDIPIDDGQLLQTNAQLGTPQSHGCIRQKREDAIELWDFAPVGTSVVVTA